MKFFSIIILSVQFITSCKNGETKISTQINKEDSLKPINLLVHKEIVSDTVTENLNSFWQTFKKAIIHFDTAQIINLTKFPFFARGPLDDDAKLEYSKQQFIPVFHAFLNQWDGQDLNGGTELDNIKQIKIQNNSKTIRIRVGDLVFQQFNKKWKLTFAYLNNETIDSLKKIGY